MVNGLRPSARARGTTSDLWPPRIDAQRAQSIAEWLHEGQWDAHGGSLLDHIGRVAATVPPDARVAAWLHEVLERTSIPEVDLLADGLTTAELRAIRLLSRAGAARSDAGYLAHVELIARAAGPGAGLAREVLRADLADRAAHRSDATGAWAPPYELGLAMLERFAPASAGQLHAIGMTTARASASIVGTGYVRRCKEE